jgi:hypothetical protein
MANVAFSDLTVAEHRSIALCSSGMTDVFNAFIVIIDAESRLLSMLRVCQQATALRSLKIHGNMSRDLQHYLAKFARPVALHDLTLQMKI